MVLIGFLIFSRVHDKSFAHCEDNSFEILTVWKYLWKYYFYSMYKTRYFTTEIVINYNECSNQGNIANFFSWNFYAIA